MPTLEKFEQDHPNIDLFLKVDSGFAKPELFHIIEEMYIPYAIRLKVNGIRNSTQLNSDYKIEKGRPLLIYKKILQISFQ